MWAATCIWCVPSLPTGAVGLRPWPASSPLPSPLFAALLILLLKVTMLTRFLLI